MASTDLKEELKTSLKSFLKLCSQHQHHLQETSEFFRKAGAARCAELEVEDCEIMFKMGAIVGGLIGELSSVVVAGAIDDLTPVSIVLGIVGSVVGGAVGGAFGGIVGAVSAAARRNRSRDNSLVRNTFLVTIGFAAGGAIGGCFQWTVGAKGGAIGGAVGTVSSAFFASNGVFTAAINYYCYYRPLKLKIKEKEHVPQTFCVFSENVKLMMEQLKTIRTICVNMTSTCAAVQRVEEHTVKALASVTRMEKALCDSQVMVDRQFVSAAEEIVQESKQTSEELKTIRTEAEELLESLKMDENDK
ncbi:uncharacterized protein LOC113156873 isoform X3 [Anabas testudineus]|uniref:uncharacterized protein LOC113156873 isoform X3 n=1 Tax=Anabas testudineus TaxID=64144 RepID=UPI000E464EAA|nr:uncharacterized protein LOC113156873 isoform X3 [Anabas testudineus]XP_026208053.1 uncharacterized protein LOC113156873 isoform X3 [Anabas testudineus]